MKTEGKPPRLYVIDPVEESRVPYLRGILTRSLQRAGLPFDEAYDVANEVRESLWAEADITLRGSEADITAAELKRVVAEYLARKGLDAVRERYLLVRGKPVVIRIEDVEGQPQPFSKGILAQTLETCALPAEQSYQITTEIEQALIQSGRTRLTSMELAELTYRHLLDRVGAEAAHRYLVWIEFARSGRALILLVGGTTGSGKSTISSEVAHRLNIARIQSTDMLREVMRLMLPQRLLPTLHTSSFNAWRVLPARGDEGTPFEPDMIDGYLTQAEQVGVGIEGVMKRAEREKVSLILEGVHLNPILQRRLMKVTSAVVVPAVLAVLKKKQLRKRLQGRSQQVTSRRLESYLEYFDVIWRLQNFMLSQADRLQVPIVINDDQDETIRSLMEIISDALVREYKGDPEDIFRDVGRGKPAGRTDPRSRSR